MCTFRAMANIKNTSQYTKKKDNTFDTLIIGGGLSGLLCAQALRASGKNFMLLEAEEQMQQLGGSHRAIHTPHGTFDLGLPFIEAGTQSMEALSFFDSVLNSLKADENLKDLGYSVDFDFLSELESIANHPIRYEASGFKPFVGFGKEAPDFVDEIYYYLSSERTEFKKPLGYWVELLAKSLNAADCILRKSWVTEFLVEDQKVVGVLVNGVKAFFAEQIIYTGHTLELEKLFPEGFLPSKIKQKLAKVKTISALSLNIGHAELVTNESRMHLLDSTTPDALGPFVGIFKSPPLDSQNLGSPIVQQSAWVGFISQDADDPENSAQLLKKMKKQLKRAYPLAKWESPLYEKIYLASNWGGDLDLSSSLPCSLPGVKNFWLTSNRSQTEKNLLGSLLQTKKLCEQLGALEFISKLNQNDSLKDDRLTHGL